VRIGINFQSKDTYLSGVEYYALGMINALLNIDTKNQYIVFTNQPDLVCTHIAHAPNLSVVPVYTPLKIRLERIIWEHFRLPQLVLQEKLNLLHCPAYICPLFDGGVPYVVTIHDTIALDHPSWCTSANALYYNAFMKSSARKASAIICVSHHTSDDLIRNYPDSRDKIRIIYPGIDPIFAPQENNLHLQDVRARYHLPNRYILFIGNFEPKKNLPALLKAFILLRQKGLPHKLVLVGKRQWKTGSFIKDYRDRYPDLIVCPGYVDRSDLPAVYAMAEAFVFASLYEGFGFPPLEAMACGTPVVTSLNGALGETLGDASYSINPNDPHDIANAIFLLIHNMEIKMKLIERGKIQASRYQWKNSAHQLLDVYKSVAVPTST